jgi:hypothetical protein
MYRYNIFTIKSERKGKKVPKLTIVVSVLMKLNDTALRGYLFNLLITVLGLGWVTLS